jgi:hypothetical protein
MQIIGGGSDLNTAINTANNNFREIQGDQQVRIIKDDQGTRVAILDKDGLRTTASGSGIDVVTADDADLTFNSNRNILRVLSEGTATIDYSASNQAGPGSRAIVAGTVTIPHGFDFIPQVMVSTVNVSNQYYPLADGSVFSMTFNSTGYGVAIWEIKVTDTNLIVNIRDQLYVSSGSQGAYSGSATLYYKFLESSIRN